MDQNQKTISPEEIIKSLDRIGRNLRDDMHSPKVLVVEDNESDAFMLMHRLGVHGVRDIKWVRDMQEAIQELKGDTQYRLVFLDLNLCGASGNDVLIECKILQPDCYVVVLTGYFESEHTECHKALKLGADCVMMKPIEDDKIKLLFNIP